jgi:hypothetical protein
MARLGAFQRGEKMKRMTRIGIGAARFCLALLFASAASAQQKLPSLHAGYDLTREVNVVGTISEVVKDSNVGPLGTHLLIHTATGTVDAHVGSAEFLEWNHLSLASGDSVRVIGESFANGTNTVFLARIVQKGTTAVAVRSPHGMPLWRAGARAADGTSKGKQGGAL